MNAFDYDKGSISIDTAGPVPIVNPRLMRAVPSNIARVIGDFDSDEDSSVNCSESDL